MLPAWRGSEWKNSANAYENDEFIVIRTLSGVRGYNLFDSKVPEHVFNPDIINEELGLAVIDALEKSRKLSLEEAGVMDKNIRQDYDTYVQKMMRRFGYKTKNALFRKMRRCGIMCENGIITIRPSHHEKLEAWSGDFITEEDQVKIGADRPPAEIGAALRLAFSRCTGMGALTD